MIRVFESEKHRKGRLGEILVRQKLETIGFVTRETNFSSRYGEIDLISQKGTIIYYVEIKSVFTNSSPNTYASSLYPEHNVSHEKIRKILRSIEYYEMLQRNKCIRNLQQSVLIAFIIINQKTKCYCVRFTGNIDVE